MRKLHQFLPCSRLSANNIFIPYKGNDYIGKNIGRFFRRQQNQFRLKWCFMGIIDTGKSFYFSGTCFLVKALRVPLLTDLNRYVYKDLNELASI
jgi:hypothetical protein